MKKRVMIFAVCMLIGLLAGAALAITTNTVLPGTMPYYDGQVVQNIQAIAPKKAANVCVSKTIHNAGDIAVFNLYTSNRWYQKVDWHVVKSSDGTDFVVQRKLGDNTIGMVDSKGSLTVNREYGSYTLATFGNNTSAGLTICRDGQ